MQSVGALFEAALKRGVSVPDSIKPLLKPDDATPWRLAERVVRSLLDDEAQEQQLVALLHSIQSATEGGGNFAESALGVVDDAMLLLHSVLRTPSLNARFDKDTALPTIYFFVVFLMDCAGVDVAVVRQHEGVVVRAAVMANRLLQNKQVYENVARAFFERCCGSCAGGKKTSDARGGATVAAAVRASDGGGSAAAAAAAAAAATAVQVAVQAAVDEKAAASAATTEAAAALASAADSAVTEAAAAAQAVVDETAAAASAATTAARAVVDESAAAASAAATAAAAALGSAADRAVTEVAA
jgi:hypothetical protein